MRSRSLVIINDRVLYRPLTGVGHYVAQLLAALRACDTMFDFQPFLGRWIRPRQRKTGRMPVPRPAPGRPGRGPRRDQPPLTCVRGSDPPLPASGGGRAREWLQAVYAWAFRWNTRGAALYHEPNHIPIRCDLPTVTTIHDLSVLVHPEWHPADRVRWYEREFDAGVRQTRCFIAASEFTRQELHARLGVSRERIHVTYQAPRPMFQPAHPAAVDRWRAEYRLPPQFLLYVGTLEPRKNIAGLLAAYGALPPPLRRRCPLVLAGGIGWKMEALAAALNQHGVAADTRLLGYLGDEALSALYTGCTALVWPTWYEGFGLPPLEALACGCPVITSHVASLPEVVADAGLLLDPQDGPAWTAAMQRMIEDADWRTGWKTRGPARAAEFTWARCAAQTLACYEAALA